MRLTGGEALARQLVREGVTHVFGVPGVQLDWAMDGLARSSGQLSYLHTRHEQAAAYMADGFARSSGRVGVCMVVPGPGVLNALAGLATAYACSSPVLLVAGQVPSRGIGSGLGYLHEVPDQTATLRSLTKWTALARRPEEIPGLVHEGVRQARSGRPRPVAVEVPPDVLEASEEAVLPPPVERGEPVVPDPAALDRASALLEGASRPVVCAGWGVVTAGAEGELRGVAEALGAPVVMTWEGRGALDDRHALALPPPAGPDALAAADVILVVGARFVDLYGRPPAAAEGAEVILLNAELADLGPPRRPALAVHGDARLGLSGILERLQSSKAPQWEIGQIDAIRKAAARRTSALEPQMSWVRALRAAIPEDGILVNELTQVGYVAQVAYPVYAARTLLSPGYQGTLGYGLSTALGAKVAHPERTVVSINGDGGLGWSLGELATARHHRIGVIVVVFVDGAFGNVRRSQVERFGGRVIGTELTNPDFPALARAFGISGTRVETPEALTGAIREAEGADEPALIEVPVGEMPSPWSLLGY